jgi:NO-binding membrane sensor protein with MHYT domain
MPNMSESFFIISWSSWVIGSALVLAMLVAVVLFRAAENLKKSSGCRQKKLWVIVGGVLSGLLLWGLPVTQLLMLPVATLDPSGMLLLLAALAVGILGAGVIQWLLGHQRLGISQLAMGGVVMGTALIGLDALLWTSVRLQLVVPHEPGQEWLLGLCWVVSVLTFAVALWLPAQPRSDSLYLRFLQRWLSPFLLGLGLASQVLMGMVLLISPYTQIRSLWRVISCPGSSGNQQSIVHRNPGLYDRHGSVCVLCRPDSAGRCCPN